MIKCPFCKYAEPYIDREADFIVNGQSVCEDHVDNASEDGMFGRALYELQREQERSK